MRCLLALLALVPGCSDSDDPACPSSVPGLVACYPFAGDARDAAGGPDGSISGATPVADRFGRAAHAYHFDGTSHTGIAVPPNDRLPATAAARTLVVWVHGLVATAGPFQSLANWGSAAATDARFGLSVYGTPLQAMFTAQDDDIRSSVAISDSGWHQLAATFDGTTATLYVDAIAAGTSSPRLATNGDSLVIGEKLGETDEPVNGDVDDVAIYGRALSGAELAQLLRAKP
jgi:hypothetical protein